MTSERTPAPRVTALENTVTWIGLLPTNDVIVLHYAVNALERVVVCLAADGHVRWTRRLAETGLHSFTWPVVIDDAGRVCIGHPDRIIALDDDGNEVATTPVPSGPDAQLGAFVVEEAYPAMNVDGTAFLVRDGAFLSIDSALQKTTLYEGPAIPNHNSSLVLTRVLLDGRGHALVGVDKTVLSFEGPFGATADSSWPCGKGTLGGNPVAKRQA